MLKLGDRIRETVALCCAANAALRANPVSPVCDGRAATQPTQEKRRPSTRRKSCAASRSDAPREARAQEERAGFARVEGVHRVAKTCDLLLSMIEQMAPLRHFEVGMTVVPSDRTYDLVRVPRFDSLADLQAYQVHSVHQAILPQVHTVAAMQVSVDYES